jgi:signal transduction histidine kinase
MIELALHMLDIAENSLRADATLVEISVIEDLIKDRLIITINDNGKGMTPEEVEHALDPFYTTKKVRRIGLGLPMLKHACLITGGSFSIESEPGAGTSIMAEFVHSHIDRQPLGDIPGAVIALILEKPEVDILYTHRRDESLYTMDTREIRAELGDIPLNHHEVINLIRGNIAEGLGELGSI